MKPAPNPKNSKEGPNKGKKKKNDRWAKNNKGENKMGVNFRNKISLSGKNNLRKVVSLHTINRTIQSFFNVSFLGFVNAPVMCILPFQKLDEILHSSVCTHLP